MRQTIGEANLSQPASNRKNRRGAAKGYRIVVAGSMLRLGVMVDEGVS